MNDTPHNVIVFQIVKEGARGQLPAGVLAVAALLSTPPEVCFRGSEISLVLSYCRYTSEPCCQDDSNVRELTCQDGRCSGPSIPCTLDSPNLECHRGMPSFRLLSQCSGTKNESGARSLMAEADHDCCPNCIPKHLGQARPVGTRAVDDNVAASTVEGGGNSNSVPTSLSASALACRLGPGRTSNHENDAASTVGDDCCSACVSKDLSASGQAYPVGTGRTADNEDIAVASTVTASRAFAELSSLCI